MSICNSLPYFCVLFPCLLQFILSGSHVMSPILPHPPLHPYRILFLLDICISKSRHRQTHFSQETSFCLVFVSCNIFFPLLSHPFSLPLHQCSFSSLPLKWGFFPIFLSSCFSCVPLDSEVASKFALCLYFVEKKRLSVSTKLHLCGTGTGLSLGGILNAVCI